MRTSNVGITPASQANRPTDGYKKAFCASTSTNIRTSNIKIPESRARIIVIWRAQHRC